MQKIILATTSPYRKEAFAMLGFDFETASSNVSESFENRPKNPEDLVRELAKRKAESVARNYSEGLVIGFDSVGYFENEILEKPKDEEDAKKRLLKMSGKQFEFHTGVCLIDIKNNKKCENVVLTKVFMRELSKTEIEKYLDQDRNFKTYALGFDPLGHASMSFIEKIEGSYNNLLRGIPMEKIVEMLKEAGVEI
ncbi:MAG: Maf family nucleotide pyrophosphatase [bacterium]|nr:Maf family nucleotide pyrophosphatase [bacterium]